MDELPHWRVLMRRELDQPNWIEFQREHGPAIAEMREVLAERGTVSNREFATGTRTRIDNYRGRKDSSLALHFLWRIGDAMIYRPRAASSASTPSTEAVAPPELIRESDPDVADDYLMTKLVGADGLAPMRTVGNFMRRKVDARRAGRVAAAQARRAANSSRCGSRAGGRRRSPWPPTNHSSRTCSPGARRPAGNRSGRPPRRRRHSSPRSTRSARAAAPRACSASSTSGRSTSPSNNGAGVPTPCRSCGATGSSRASTPGWTVRRPRSSSTACGSRTESLAKDEAFVEAFGRGMDRLMRFLEAGRIDVQAVTPTDARERPEPG